MIRTLVIAAATIGLASCGTLGDSAREIVACGTSCPEPRERFSYANTSGFDEQLYSSLSSDLETVRVSLTNNHGAPMPKRLGKFAGAVVVGGGKVHQCETNTAEGLFSWSAVWSAVQGVTRASVARDYHMILEANSATKRIEGVRFVHRVAADWDQVEQQYAGCKVVSV